MRFSYFSLALLTFCTAFSSGLFAQSLYDDTRLQAVVEQQRSVLVRVKAVVDLPAEAMPQADSSTGVDIAATLPAEASAPAETAPTSAASKTPDTFLRLGTGFFVSADGLIITNASVVDGARRVWYEVDSVPYLAEVRGIDIPTNIALLQAKTMPKRIASVNLADSVTLPPMGSLLVRLSLPLDFGATPTLGLVQGSDASFGARGFPTRYMRVSFTTAPGEAGSPVFDLQGRFVGSSVAVLPELNAAYVLPARALAWVKEGLVAGGHVYSYFGFTVDEEHTPEGVRLVVKTVDDKGPATALKVGDVIYEAARKSATTLGDLRDAAFYTKPGQYLDLKLRRGKEELAVSIQALGKNAAPAPAAATK